MEKARETLERVLASPYSGHWKLRNGALPLRQLYHTAPSPHSGDTEAHMMEMSAYPCLWLPVQVFSLGESFSDANARVITLTE